MSAEILDQVVGERTRGVRPGVGLCLETGDNGESLRGSSSWEEKVGISVHCVPSHWQSPGHPVLLSVAPRKSPSLTCRCHFCQEKTGVTHRGNYWFGFDFHSKQSSQPELVSDLKADY